MLFRQIAAQRGDALAYLIGCPRTREAVLVDPLPAEAERYRRGLERLGLRLRWVVETSRPDPRFDHVRAYATLLTVLGTGDEAPPIDPHALLGVGRVGPLAAQDGAVADVEVGEHVARLWLHPTTPPSGDAGRPPLDGSRVHHRLALPFGELSLDVWASAPRRLVVMVEDRALTGAAAYTGRPGALCADPSLRAVLELPGDTLVFPAEAPHGIRLSTVGQERAWLHGRQVEAGAPTALSAS
jgi:hypothetical protein